MPPFDCTQDDSGPWSPKHCGVEIERLAPGVMALRHPSYPFRGLIDANGNLLAQARTIAREYLRSVWNGLGIESDGVEAAVLFALDPRKTKANRDKQEGFGWLDVAWGSRQEELELPPEPRLSFWVARQDNSGGILDRTLVLCAGFRHKGLHENGEKGLRVVMHIGTQPNNEGRYAVRVAGASVSLPTLAAAWVRNQEEILAALNPWSVFAQVRTSLPFSSLAWLGYSFVEQPNVALRFFINGSRSGTEDSSPRSYATVAEITRDAQGELQVRTAAQSERVTHAAEGMARVFPRDPASAGPARDIGRRGVTAAEAVLDRFRRGDGRLRERLLATSFIEVRQSALDGGDPSQKQKVRPTDLPLRSNDLGAAHAYIRGCNLFDRMQSFGFRPEDYFRLAKLPLLLRHRARITPGGGDGLTVNAQVRPIGNALPTKGRQGDERTADGLTWDEPYDARDDQRSQIEVRFAVADLSHRFVRKDARGRRRAQYLGLAADPRWAWHEFGHVLNLAATGELELRFAHSIGDALAAVACDAESKLAHPPAGDSGRLWRGATFPWVALGRRHDRRADAGWSWSGHRYREAVGDPLASGERFRSYFAEQLLSSSIFRLYQSIGGDSGDSDDTATRCSAADFVTYLLLRAIALLGPQLLVPTRTVDQFVSALIDADIGTGAWTVDTPWNDEAAAKAAARVGGCVHKVIRWAFEQQGLRAGAPPVVDLYIADRRKADVADGGYWPVPLRWDTQIQPWHAQDEAIEVQGSEVRVRVRNRGLLAARNVRVYVWTKLVGETIAEPWTLLDATSKQPGSVEPGAEHTFRFDAGKQIGRKPGECYVVAAATCPADRANNDPAAGLPCSQMTTPLVDLIANDNNLGLRVIRIG